jgi:hypothetical protein
MLTAKDEQTLINKVNRALSNYHARVMVKEVPERICSFYEARATDINADVVVVRTQDDAPAAARARNTSEKALFVFSDQFRLTSYFSGVCQDIKLSKALIDRTLR